MLETFLPPNRQLATRTRALPANASGMKDIVDGWLVSQMHLAGMNVALIKANGPVATSAITELLFFRPLHEGEDVSCFAEVIRLCDNGLTVNVEAYVYCKIQKGNIKLATGVFKFKAVDKENNPRIIPRH
ncbi:MAG: acyl-CoA thioesterase [Alphaproteobacteria bacterium]|jgi:acyl-CoA thioesterase YciA|nr:acyl-CoA thioesterase [Alphaproteobacteria bacterium]